MSHVKLTQLAVDRLKPPTGKAREEYWDTQLPGFGLRITAEGRKVWQAMYRVRGRLKRETLGSLAVIPKVDEARGLARASMLKARQGIDPVAEKKAAEESTVEAVFSEYMGKKKKRIDG